MRTYIDPVIDKSYITEHRSLIRSSKRLNELLYKNTKALTKIFELAPKKFDNHNTKFEINTGMAIFLPLVKSSFLENTITAREIDRCFVASMMTIYDERKRQSKYQHLYYVEFLEFLCRVAYVGSDPESCEPIAFKV